QPTTWARQNEDAESPRMSSWLAGVKIMDTPVERAWSLHGSEDRLDQGLHEQANMSYIRTQHTLRQACPRSIGPGRRAVGRRPPRVRAERPLPALRRSRVTVFAPV